MRPGVPIIATTVRPTPHARTRMSASFGPGFGIGTSSSVSGAPNAFRTIAFMRVFPSFGRFDARCSRVVGRVAQDCGRHVSRGDMRCLCSTPSRVLPQDGDTIANSPSRRACRTGASQDAHASMDSLNTKPTEPADYEADVVIIGFGSAGGCAAIEARDARRRSRRSWRSSRRNRTTPTRA